jgi:hypothetical protein
MADGFGQLDAPLGSVQGALADFHVAQFLARGTRLGLVEQLRLLDSEILHDVAGDGLSDFASAATRNGGYMKSFLCLSS